MPEDGRKWAVENRNVETGQSVRLIETHQERVAQMVCKMANERFAEAGSPMQSYVIKI